MEWLSPIREVFEFIVPILDRLPFIRAGLGFVMVFFLPGFAWTLVLFNRRQINVIERLVLSFALSMAVVVLSILVLNRVIGMTINGLNAVLIIGTVTFVPLLLYSIRRLGSRQSDNGT